MGSVNKNKKFLEIELGEKKVWWLHGSWVIPLPPFWVKFVKKVRIFLTTDGNLVIKPAVKCFSGEGDTVCGDIGGICPADGKSCQFTLKKIE